MKTYGLKLHATRFSYDGQRLYYTCQRPGLWRFVMVDSGGEALVGFHYPTRQALVDDMARYAAEYGLA